MKIKTIILSSAIIAAFSLGYYLYVPNHFLPFPKHQPTEERLRERYDSWHHYYTNGNWGRMWELQTRKLQQNESKLKRIMTLWKQQDKPGNNPQDYRIEKIEINGTQAKVFVYNLGDYKTGAVELWIYEGNDWYRDIAPSEWTLQWLQMKIR